MADRLSRGLLLVSVVAAAFAMSHRAAHAADPSAISVAPATASADAGDDVALDIDAANIPAQPGLGGYLIVLKWDPAVLVLTSFTDTGWVTSGEIVVICTTPMIDNTSGTAEADCTPIIGFGSGVSTTAPNALAHAVFHAKAPGSTAIDLSGSSLLNSSNVALTTTLANGSVTVAAAPTATPSPVGTSTAEPTNTPSAASATSTPVPQATPQPISPTSSTKPAQETLSKVDVPRTGSVAAADTSGPRWKIPALAAVGAALLGLGGLAAFRMGRRHGDDG